MFGLRRTSVMILSHSGDECTPLNTKADDFFHHTVSEVWDQVPRRHSRTPPRHVPAMNAVTVNRLPQSCYFLRRPADWDRRPPAGNTGRRDALPSPKRSFSFAQAGGGPSRRDAGMPTFALARRTVANAWTRARSAPTLRACSIKKIADDERRIADCGLLREVRTGHGLIRQGVAREAQGPAARSVRDRVHVREPGRARVHLFADRARL